MPKLDLASVPRTEGSSYPSPYGEPCRGRSSRRVGQAAGLTRLGANLVTLAPGAWSSQRHWHSDEDELAYVISGELVLVEDGGETTLQAGDFASWPAGVKDGHHLQNRSDAPATFLVVSNRSDADHGEYPDLDMVFSAGRYSGKGGFLRRDGSAF